MNKKLAAFAALSIVGVSTSQAALTAFSDDMSDIANTGWTAPVAGEWEQDVNGYGKVVGPGTTGSRSAGTLEASDEGATISVTFDWVELALPVDATATLTIGGVAIDTNIYTSGDGSSTGNTLTALVSNAQATANEEVAVNFVANGGGWSQTGVDNVTLTVTPAAVPEPSSTALLGLGGLALMLRRRK